MAGSFFRKGWWRSEDNAKFAKNVLANYLIKAGAMLVALLTMPAYLSYFHSQKLLGMWFTMVAILNWLMLFDIGVGGGIRNCLVGPLQREDREEIQKIMSAGFISTGAMVLILLIVQYFVVRWVNWYVVLNVSPLDISHNVLYMTIHILLAGICVRFFTVLVCHIFYAMQEAAIPGFLILSSNVLILVYMKLASPSGNATDLIRLAIAHAVATNLPTAVAIIVLFSGRFREAMPSFRSFHKIVFKQVLGQGVGLFYLQILVSLVLGVKELFIAWFVGADQVVDYSIYYKLIGTVSSIFSLTLTPVWSAVTKAYIKGEFGRIRRLYIAGATLIGIFAVLQMSLVAIMPWVVRIWLGEKAIEVSCSYGLIFCGYNLLYMWIMMNYNFSCGMGKIRVIAFSLSLAAVLNIAVAYWGCQLWPVWATVVASTAVALVPAAIIVPKDVLNFETGKV